MLNQASLKQMAELAKQNLKEQGVKDEAIENMEVEEDIYASLRDEVANSDNQEEQMSYEIKNTPSSEDRVEHNEVYMTPQEEYFNGFPEYRIEREAEAVFPGGPDKFKLDAWKKQFDGYGIYVAEIDDNIFIFRTLNRFEYKQIVALQNLDALQREEIICETVTLWPENFTWDKMATGKAGIPSTYSEIIMSKSGFTKEYSIQVL